MSFDSKELFNLDPYHLYFDCAASPPPFKGVISAVNDFLNSYGSIHRGKGKFSIKSSELFENARNTIAAWINATQDDVVTFVSNTTDAINQVALSIDFTGYKNTVAILDIEHSSNVLPWLVNGANLLKIPVNSKSFSIDLNVLEEQINIHKNKLVLFSTAGIHNLTGQILPLEKVHEITQRYNIPLMIDGSQTAPHVRPSLSDCELLTFSGHKMYAPLGSGVLAGKKNLFQTMGKRSTGGGNVHLITSDNVPFYKELPWRLESGTPNGAGAIAIASAINILSALGEDFITSHNNELSLAFFNLFSDEERIFPNSEAINLNVPHSPVLLFKPNKMSIQKFCSKLNPEYISYREGTFCVYGLFHLLSGVDVKSLPIPETWKAVRFSAGLCTSKNDILKLKMLIDNVK